MELTPSTPWWQTDAYTHNIALPSEFDSHAGKHGPMLVIAFEDGRTEPGWSLNSVKEDGPTFVTQYGELTQKRKDRALKRFMEKDQPFAFVMRSVDMLCIDIDGKNGGFDGAKTLGLLPPTMAETSKSGTGMHLFYRTGDTWQDGKGYAKFPDRIGIAPGVDIRAVGCVYHHSTQRWNARPLAQLPRTLEEQMLHFQERRAADAARLQSIINEGDPVETAMLHDELIRDLAKPIKDGTRNNSLFAMGMKMAEAGVPHWDSHIKARAVDVGLPLDEINRLIANVGRQVKKP